MVKKVVDENDKEWLRASEVAALIGVSSKTVSRWANAGRINCSKTLGGHRRFARKDVEKLLKKAS